MTEPAWKERWFRALGAACQHEDRVGDDTLLTVPRNPVCGDCALALCEQALAEQRAAHEREIEKWKGWATNLEAALARALESPGPGFGRRPRA